MTEKRQIGSVEQMEEQAQQQWGTVGGNKPGSPQCSTSWWLRHPGTWPPRYPGSRKPERKRQTVYLYPDLYSGYGIMQLTQTGDQ